MFSGEIPVLFRLTTTFKAERLGWLNKNGLQLWATLKQTASSFWLPGNSGLWMVKSLRMCFPTYKDLAWEGLNCPSLAISYADGKNFGTLQMLRNFGSRWDEGLNSAPTVQHHNILLLWGLCDRPCPTAHTPLAQLIRTGDLDRIGP